MRRSHWGWQTVPLGRQLQADLPRRDQLVCAQWLCPVAVRKHQGAMLKVFNVSIKRSVWKNQAKKKHTHSAAVAPLLTNAASRFACCPVPKPFAFSYFSCYSLHFCCPSFLKRPALPFHAHSQLYLFLSPCANSRLCLAAPRPSICWLLPAANKHGG